MNKQRKTSHILNVFQYNHTTGAVTLPAGLSLPTPDSTDNSTKVATTAWIRAYVGSLSYATASSVETAIADLVASAPTTLNTLNELATALGNDPNFATTITTSIGTKVPQSRTITINGTAYDLSADRAWTIASGVTSFNTRTGAIVLSSADVTGALGFTPYNATNPSGYITGITSGMVTGALGYTPYNSSNPSGYITSSALTSYALPLSGGTMTGSIVNNTDGAVILESNASENNNWLWKENAKQWGLFWFNRGSQSGQTIGSYTTVGAELMFMGGSSGIAMPSGWTGYIAGSNIAAMISNYNGYIYSASTVYAAGDMRAPIFYDINDTGYYGNFASTSRVNGIYADYIGIGQDINTSYRLITNGSIYLNSNGNGWAEGVFKQRRSGSTFYDVIDAGNIGGQTVAGLNADFLGTGTVSLSRGYSCVLRNENGSGAAVTYAPLLHMAASDTMWQLQGTYGTSGNGTLYFRQGYSGSWGNWLTMLSSANYSSYALPLSGGTLTGTLNFANGDGALQSATSGGVSFYQNEINAGAQGGTGSLYLGWRRTNQINIGAAISSSSTIYTTGIGSFGADGGSDTGIRINYNSSGYGRIRFYQDGSNHQTIHSFGSNGYSPSNGKINIDGQNGANIGAWNDPDFVVNKGAHTYARAYRGIGNVAGTGEASYHPAGMYSVGTQWLYGDLHRNNANTHSQGHIYCNGNYGYGLVGLYSSTKYQAIFAMGDAYKIHTDGSGLNNLYGLAWSHPNAGGQAGYLNDHGLIVGVAGTTYAAISSNIWARGSITANSNIYGNDVYTTGGWFRNHSNTNGIYWSTTGWHLMPYDSSDFRMHSGNSSATALRMETNGTTRGYFYANSSNEVGILTSDRNWALRIDGSKTTHIHGNLIVGYGQTSSNIWMGDTDETQRRIHCNSNRIGFLNSSDGWGAWCNNDGSFQSARKVQGEYLYSDGWVYSSGGNTGWYQDNQGQGIRAAGYNTSYGTIATYGTNTGGHAGYAIMNNYRVILMQDSSGNFGFYNNDDWAWQLFFNRGNNCWGIGTDNTYSGDGFRCVKYGSSQYGWTTWSDRRAKENITSITGALDKVLNMRGVYFNYISDGAKTQRVGFIAQELEEVLPQAVRYAEEIDEYNVEYAQIVSVLTEAIKEQNVKITRLEALVEQLTNN